MPSSIDGSVKSSNWQLHVIASNGEEFLSAVPRIEGPGSERASALTAVLKEFSARIFPAYRPRTERFQSFGQGDERKYCLADASSFFNIDAPQSVLDELAKKLADLPGVEAVYLMPPQSRR